MAPAAEDGTIETGPIETGSIETSQAAVERDGNDLRRSLRINLVGYAIKFAYPFLLILVINLYGAGPYGVFALVQGVLTVMLRVSLLGLDKGLLWWIPRLAPADERQGLRATLILTTLCSLSLALLTALVLAPVIAAWAERPDMTPGLRWMALGLVPMALLEVLTQACVGKRRLEAHILFKEGLVSFVLVAAAVLCYALGLERSGLEVAFVASYLAGLVGVLWVFRSAFAASQWQGPALRVPAGLWRYSWRMWLNDCAGAVFNRMDVFILAALTDDVSVGVFTGASQYAQQVMAIRWSFDPMLVAMISQIGHANDHFRLRRGFARAWLMVAVLEIPLLAFMVAAAAWIMPLLGEKYAHGVGPALVLLAMFGVNGMFGFNQHIVSGFGRSGLTLTNTLVSIVIGAGMLALLIPPFGLVGAAWGIGSAYLALNVIWAVQARMIVGRWHYEASIGWTLALTAVAVAAMAATWAGVDLALGTGVNGTMADLAARVAALLVFGAVFGPGMWYLRRSGRFAGGPAPAA